MLLSVVLACGGGNGDTKLPDAGIPADQCAATCPSDHDCCEFQGESFCIDTSRDKDNCGTCGNRCTVDVADGCGGGHCKCGQGAACTDGKTCISAAVGCRDMKSDPQNCGSPGHKCGPEETCAAGVCSCGGDVCGANMTCCSGHCSDTKTDPDNCGACHNTCEGQENACLTGACACPGGGHCATPTYNNVGMCCGTGCNNVCTDAMNCGACGHACAVGHVCNLGGCDNEPNPNPQLCTVFPLL